MERHAIEEARRFLEGSVGDVREPHTAALVAYALTLLQSSKAQPLINLLNTMAHHKGQHGSEK